MPKADVSPAAIWIGACRYQFVRGFFGQSMASRHTGRSSRAIAVTTGARSYLCYTKPGHFRDSSRNGTRP
jgi:hypothetical protein